MFFRYVESLQRGIGGRNDPKARPNRAAQLGDDRCTMNILSEELIERVPQSATIAAGTAGTAGNSVTLGVAGSVVVMHTRCDYILKTTLPRGIENLEATSLLEAGTNSLSVARSS